MLHTIRANNWTHLRDTFAQLHGCVFRGQSNDTWPLETSLYREGARNLRNEGQTLSAREEHMLSAFQRVAHQFRDDLPPANAHLDWLALMQHYGCPTRLLDFTYSSYVALYFATEAADGDSAVWVINSMRPGMQKSLDQHNRPIPYNRQAVLEENEKYFNQTLLKRTYDLGVLILEPNRLHERLWIQQGLFLAPVNPNAPFLANLAEAYGLPDIHSRIEVATPSDSDALKDISYGYASPGRISAVKVVIPHNLRGTVLAELRSMNISSATLFPGLEGFARSLRHFL